MTELEKMKRAGMYMSKLANGVDPLTDMEIPGDSLLNNVRLSRCFFYVTEILDKVIENGGEVGKARKGNLDFYITPQETEKMTFFEAPVQITALSKRINETFQKENMKNLPVTAITDWLVDKGFLHITVGPSGKKRKAITPQSAIIGITSETRESSYGKYEAVLYNKEAQKFIMDNLPLILEERKMFKAQFESNVEQVMAAD